MEEIHVADCTNDLIDRVFHPDRHSQQGKHQAIERVDCGSAFHQLNAAIDLIQR